MVTARTALVLIDFQEWIVRDLTGANGRVAAEAAALATKLARDGGELVVHVQYLHSDGSDGGPGSTESRFLDCINVLPGEPIITKYARSAFDETEFESLLNQATIRRVVLAGVVTEGGVEATAIGALDRGFEVCVLSDAVVGSTPLGHAEALKRMADAGCELLGQEDSLT
jgi:nicotinamidase-related amidase